MGPKDEVWRIARHTRDWLRDRGAWEPLEPAFSWLAPRLVRPEASELEFSTPDGFRLAIPPEFPSGQRYREGCYEPEMVALFRRTLRPGWTVIDAGANIGYFTLLASRLVGPSGRVIAFEPDPTNFEYLVRNIRANGCANVQAERLALSDRTGSLPFRRDRFKSEGHLVEGSPPGRGAIAVPTVRLDDFAQQHRIDTVQFIKFDIEGGEPAALRGMAESSRRWPELRLVVEFSRRALTREGRPATELFDVLRSLGFKFVRSTERPDVSYSLDRTPPLAGHAEGFEVWR